MRTTVTLEPDTEALVRELMTREGIGFKEAINRAIRLGLAPSPRRRFRQRTFAMGFRPDIPYDKALQLAGDVEDRELLRGLARGVSG
jgi:hypothetical protein